MSHGFSKVRVDHGWKEGGIGAGAAKAAPRTDAWRQHHLYNHLLAMLVVYISQTTRGSSSGSQSSLPSPREASTAAMSRKRSPPSPPSLERSWTAGVAGVGRVLPWDERQVHALRKLPGRTGSRGHTRAGGGSPVSHTAGV